MTGTDPERVHATGAGADGAEAKAAAGSGPGHDLPGSRGAGSADPPHEPVMKDRCLELLAVGRGGWYVDGTFGAGGHTRAILERGGCVLAIDRDPGAARYADAIDGCLRLVRGDFRDLDQHVAHAEIGPVAGVLLDLGVSSMQLDEAERGFAFRQEGPLDMRMSAAGDTTVQSAADVVNSYAYEDLAAIIYRYGEERHSRRIARAIVEARDEQPITTTAELADVVQRAYPGGSRREHPARRTFQALRIHVNDELAALEEGLEAAQRALAPGGVVVVLSYHSLEDRIVKHFLRGASMLEPITKKPETASEAEVAANPRARSAKLRAATKVAAPGGGAA